MLPSLWATFICLWVLQELHPMDFLLPFSFEFATIIASTCNSCVILEGGLLANMQIMLTNDDGVYAYGILALAKALQAQGGHQIHIVAPDREQSGTAHSFTFLTPLHAEPVRLEGLEKGDAFGVSGTPTDCVKVGVSNLLADKPDCIISGINHGQNLGIDTTYSGTVSAALEGALLGIPAWRCPW